MRYGLIYLGSEKCPACRVFGPLLRAFALRHGLEVLAVSTTGGALEGWPEAVADEGRAERLGIKAPGPSRTHPLRHEVPGARSRSHTAWSQRINWPSASSPSPPGRSAVTTRRIFMLLILGAAFFFAVSARADVLSEMENFWRGAAVNTTGPTAFDGQASGHWTLGNLYLRAPVRSESVATISLPSYRAGCGGIDAFAGAFSFIDSDQMIAFARAVAQNAAGFAFELALETISPVIAETMSKLRALGPVGEQPERKLLRDGAGPGRRGLVQERPGERSDLRRDRDAAGNFFGLRRRAPRLRGGRETPFDPGGRYGASQRTGAGQRELRLARGKGFRFPGIRPRPRRVRHVGIGERHRDGAPNGFGSFRSPACGCWNPWRSGPPRDRGVDGGGRRPPGLPLRHGRCVLEPHARAAHRAGCARFQEPGRGTTPPPRRRGADGHGAPRPTPWDSST